MSASVSLATEPTSSMVEMSDKAHSEFLALFQMTIDDIERGKEWAWGVMYYTVLGQGGILALYSAYAVSPPGIWVRATFFALLAAITVASHVSITHSFESLQAFRARANRCREFFEPTSLTILGEPRTDRTWPLRAFVWATFVVTSALLFLHSPTVQAGP